MNVNARETDGTGRDVRDVHQYVAGILEDAREATRVLKSTGSAMTSVSKAVKRAAAELQDLFSFDEINRLSKPKTGSGRSSSGNTENSQAEEKVRRSGTDLWALFRAGIELGAGSGALAGDAFTQALGAEFRAGFGDGKSWAEEHIWNPIRTGWAALGEVKVTVGNTLKNTAAVLWEGFRGAWNNGTSRAVSIGNALKNTALALWEGFRSAWGGTSVRTVEIGNRLKNAAASLWSEFRNSWGDGSGRRVVVENTLKNTAASLWSRFKSGWSGKTLGLTVTYSTNVSNLRKAVYRALGLSGWPTISFAARGGVFNSATLTMLGEAGTEAVVPLENNTGWMDKMAEMLIQRMAGGTGGAITIPIYIGGEKLTDVVVDTINDRTRRTGSCPIRI